MNPGGKSSGTFMELSFPLNELLQHRIEPVTPASLICCLGPNILQDIEYTSLAA